MLLGRHRMSSAPYDTAAGLRAQTEKRRLGARLSALSLSLFLLLPHSLPSLPFCWSLSPLSLRLLPTHPPPCITLSLSHLLPLLCIVHHCFSPFPLILLSYSALHAPSLSPSFSLSLFATLITSSALGDKVDQWQVVRGHVGAGSRKSAPIPTLTLALLLLSFSLHTHTCGVFLQPAWRTSQVKCQLTN